MEQDEDGEMSAQVMLAVCKQAGLLDEVMHARIKRILSDQWLSLHYEKEVLVGRYQKLLRIIAYMYQVAGVHDCPEHILDVLSDPEGATEEQIDAMLPYPGGA